MNLKPPPPFSCSYSPNFPELLYGLECTIALSTYQAGKIILISAVDTERLIQLPRSFDRVMGIALDGNRLALAAKDEVIVLVDDPRLAPKYPKNPGVYDALYMPRATFYTGQVDIHDLSWTDEGLIGVNTSFSCLMRVSDRFSWEAVWRPPFIDQLVSEDRCHLNGMALVDGQPKYVTALGTNNTRQGWRQTLPSGGILMDIESNEVLLSNLSMPHSPRLIEKDLYLLLSATGEIIRVNQSKRTFEVIKKLDGFVRGMAFYNDYLFVGLSKLRQNSSTFKHLEMAKLADKSGIIVLHLPTSSVVAELTYQTSVDEIYDVQIIPGKRRPGILNTMSSLHKYGLSIPEGTFWAKEIL